MQELLYEAIVYLKDKGHRKIGAVVGPNSIYTSKKLFEGFIKAIRDLTLISFNNILTLS